MPKMGSTFWRKAWGPLQGAFEAQREADAGLNSTSKVKSFTLFLFDNNHIG